MTHADHVNLIKNGISKKGGVWADFGSGEGAFTLALRDVGGEDIEIFSIDKNRHSLQLQEKNFTNMFPQTNIHFVVGDFSEHLQLPPLDGIIAANSLHFLKDKSTILSTIKKYLKPDGRLIIVEYNVDKGNVWVPYPFSYDSCLHMMKTAGFSKTEFLSSIPSTFLEEIYSAVVYL